MTQDESARLSLKFALMLLFELRLAGAIPKDKQSTVDAFIQKHVSEGTTWTKPEGTDRT